VSQPGPLSDSVEAMGLSTYLAQASWQPQRLSSSTSDLRSDRAEVGAWKKTCTAPFLVQGEEKEFLLAFVVVKSGE